MTERETLVEFPCLFPIKAVGETGAELEAAVIEIINRHVDNLPEGSIRLAESKQGKYTSITVTIMAQNQQQLDAIYQDLTVCEHVVMAL